MPMLNATLCSPSTGREADCHEEIIEEGGLSLKRFGKTPRLKP